MPTFNSCSWRIVPSGAKYRLKALGTARLMAASSIIVLYMRDAPAIVRLLAVAQAAEQEGDAEREQEIRQDRADDRRTHHVELAGAQRHQRDDELGRVAEGRIEQSAHRIAGVSSELLGERTIRAAIGTIASAAEKKISGAGSLPACSSAT